VWQLLQHKNTLIIFKVADRLECFNVRLAKIFCRELGPDKSNQFQQELQTFCGSRIFILNSFTVDAWTSGLNFVIISA